MDQRKERVGKQRSLSERLIDDKMAMGKSQSAKLTRMKNEAFTGMTS